MIPLNLSTVHTFTLSLSKFIANTIKLVFMLHSSLLTVLFPQLQERKWKSLSRVWLFATPWTIQSMEFSRPGYWSGSCSLLQGIFSTQRGNPGLPHCKQILHQLSHQGNPRMLEWVAIPSLEDLPKAEIETRSPALQVDSLPADLPGKSYQR